MLKGQSTQKYSNTVINDQSEKISVYTGIDFMMCTSAAFYSFWYDFKKNPEKPDLHVEESGDGSESNKVFLLHLRKGVVPLTLSMFCG